MLCNSYQRLDLDQICGLALGDNGSNGYRLTSGSERITLHHDGFEETRLSCDLCQAVFGPKSSRFPLALLTSAEPGVLPVSFVMDGLDEKARHYIGTRSFVNRKLFDIFCSQGTSFSR